MINTDRPLVTFALIAYNQEEYIREAVESALAQDYSPLEIIISDDCSKDNTFNIIQEVTSLYKGNHKVVINRNPENIGIGSHINKLNILAKGKIVVVAAGDDISIKERTTVLANYFKNNIKCMSLFSNMIIIDEYGTEHGAWVSDDWVYPVKTQLQNCMNGAASVFGCTHAWRRDVFDIFGPMDSRVVHEDLAIPFRSALIGTVDYINVNLVYYRRHSENICLTPDNLIKYRNKRIYHASGMSGVWQTMKCDFLKYIELHNTTNNSFSNEIYMLRMGLINATFEFELLNCHSLICKLKKIISGPWNVSKIKIVVRYMLIEYFPRLYLWRVRLRSKANKNNL